MHAGGDGGGWRKDDIMFSFRVGMHDVGKQPNLGKEGKHVSRDTREKAEVRLMPDDVRTLKLQRYETL